MQILARDGNIDNLVLIASTKPGWRVTPQQMEDDFILMSDIKKSTSKPVIALVYFSTPEAEPEARRIILKFQEIGIPAFPSVQRGARALKNALDYYRLRNDTGN